MVFSLFSLFSCKSNESKSAVYIYNTPEFHTKLKDFSISLEDATDLLAKSYFEENPKILEYQCNLSIIYGNYYIFTTKPYLYNLKQAKYNLSGFWINGKTKEIKNVNTDEYVKIILPPPTSTYLKNIQNKKKQIK